MKDFQNKVAAITGAGSGIGRALAISLSEQGCHVAIADVNKTALQETADLVADNGVNVTLHMVDVASREQVYQFADDVIEQHGAVHLVFNNAGVALASTIEDHTYEEFEWLMNINFWGVVYGTKAFLPQLQKNSEAHIINF
ncbi:MAG: SDR family NAD(P)-dependent oxidoreductase, partial [Pseudomonadota bacterium]